MITHLAKIFIGSLLLIMFDLRDYIPEFMGGNPDIPIKQQKAQVNPETIKGSVVNYSTKQSPLDIVKPLLDQNEGFKEQAYYDKLGKVWTIGNGLTYYPDGSKVKQGDTITREQNNKYVDSVLQERVSKLSKYPNWSKLNPNQQATLLDFSYNTGANFNKTDNKLLIEALSNPQKINELPKVMASYRMSGGKVVQGLVNRRERANKLFNTPYEQQNNS
jgi:lysozyme